MKIKKPRYDISEPGFVNEIKNFLCIDFEHATPYDIIIDFIFRNLDKFKEYLKYSYSASFSNTLLCNELGVNSVEDLYMSLYYVYEKISYPNSFIINYRSGFSCCFSNNIFCIKQIYDDRVEFLISESVFKVLWNRVHRQKQYDKSLSIWDLKMPEGFVIYKTCHYSNISNNLNTEWLLFKANRDIKDFYSGVLFHLDEIIKGTYQSEKINDNEMLRTIDTKVSEDNSIDKVMKQQNGNYKISYFLKDKPSSFWSNNVTELTKKEKGDSFVDYCIELLTYIGFKNIKKTKDSHDFGGDILATKNGLSYTIQCKNWNKKIGTKAVSEVNTARDVYGTVCALVLTKEASEKTKFFANSLNVDVWDENDIGKITLQIEKFKYKTFYN